MQPGHISLMMNGPVSHIRRAGPILPSGGMKKSMPDLIYIQINRGILYTNVQGVNTWQRKNQTLN